MLLGTALIAAVALGTFAVGPAIALTPPPPPSGIAFSFSGQIVRIAADGSDRRELTMPGPFANGDIEDRVGDASPQLSPDGSHLLVTRLTPRDLGVRERIVLTDADGSGAKPVLQGTKKVSFSAPAWMPDGQSVAVAREIDRRRGYARSVVIAGLDGKSVKTVFKLPLHRTGENFKLDEATYRVPIDIGVSPDGRKLLVTVSNGYFYDRKYLVLVDLETGKQRTIGKNTRSGSFSPDGERFVYVSSAGNRGETCTETDETSCVIQGDLYTQNTDGGGKQRVTHSRAAEENPDWSPDGLRIAFDANYNLPKSGAAAEIYAIAPNGSCLSWLTNGSPAAVEPDWSPDAGRSDLACGTEPREPVLAGDWTTLGAEDAAKSVWGGPVSGDRLVSQAVLVGPFRFAKYNDCAVFDRKACAPATEFDIGGISTCFAGLYLGLVVGEAKRSAFGHRKGVAFLRESGRRSKVKRIIVFTGDSMVSISGNRRTSFSELEAQIDTLRPVDAVTPPKKLPGLYLPKGVPNAVKLVARLVKRTGIKHAAKRLDAKPNDIRPLLTFSRRMKMLGPIKTEACSKEEADPFGDID